MNRWIRFLWILGLVVFGFGFLGALVVGSFSQVIMAGHMLLGVALIIVWFFLSGIQNVSETKQIISGRVARYGVNALLYTAVFLGLLGVVNFASKRNEKRWDLTEQGVYSLTDQSLKVAKGLKSPLRIVVFKDSQGAGAEAADSAELFHEANPSNITVDVVDPRAKPHLVDSYGMKQGNLVYLEFGDGAQKAVSRLNEGTEEALTNAIIRLSRGAAKKIYYIEGHGEPDMKDIQEPGFKAAIDALEDEHLKVEGLFIGTLSVIPPDAAAVILASPKKPMQESERKLLLDYVNGGGRLLMLNDPRFTQDVRMIASDFGIQVGEDVVIDQVQRLFAAPALGAQPIVRDYAEHDLTRSMTPQHITIFNIASSVRKGATVPQGANVVELIKTSPSSWAETNLSMLFDSEDASATLEPNDIKGPVPIAAAFEKTLSSNNDDAKQDGEFNKVARVVVFGDSDWILNANIGLYANRDLFMNSVNWLVGEEGGISIRPKSMRASTAPIESSTFTKLFVAGFIIPELILIFGLLVWWRRRTTTA